MKNLSRQFIALPVLAALVMQTGLTVAFGDILVAPGSLATSSPNLQTLPPRQQRPPHVLANGITGSISDPVAGNASVWVDAPPPTGVFDLSTTKALHMTFSPSSIGHNFFVRLLPKADFDAGNFGSVNWLNNTHIYTVPSSGKLDIPISDFINTILAGGKRMTPDILKQIGQISLDSGSNAFFYPLNQGAFDRVTFITINKIVTSAPAKGLHRRALLSEDSPADDSSTDVSSSDNSDSSMLIDVNTAAHPGAVVGQGSLSDNYLSVLSAAGLNRAEATFNPQSVGNPASLSTPDLSSHAVGLPK